MKIVDYLSMGRPVLVPQSSYYDYVEEYQIGARYQPGNKNSFAEMLAMLTEDDAENRRLGQNARAYAIDHLDWRFTLAPLYSMIDSHSRGIKLYMFLFDQVLEFGNDK